MCYFEIDIPVKGKLENIDRFKYLIDDELLCSEFGISIEDCNLIDDKFFCIGHFIPNFG